jgi:hypothetical protein
MVLPPAFNATPRFAPNPEYAAFSSAAASSGGFLGGITPEQQALAQRLAAAGYRLDDSRLNRIDELMGQERAAKEGLMYAGVGLMQMQTGDPLYEWGTAQSTKAANNIVNFVKDKAPDQVAWYNEAATETSYRRAGLNIDGSLSPERTGLKGVWNRLRPGVQLGADVLDENGQIVKAGHTSIMNSAKQQLLEEARLKNPHLTTELLEQLPETKVTASGRTFQHVKNATRPVVEPLANTIGDIKSTVGNYIERVRGIDNTVTNNLSTTPSPPITGTPPVTPTNTAANSVANATTNVAQTVATEAGEALATTASSAASTTATNTAAAVVTTVATETAEAAGQGLLSSITSNPGTFAKNVGVKSLGVIGAGIAVYQVGSNAIENYKAGDYRNVVKDVAGQATGLAVSSVLAGALTPVATGGLLAASAALTATGVLAPVGAALAFATPLLAPLVAGVAGGIIGQVATEATKWGLDPLLKWAGFKNSSDKARDEIKQNRELLTNIATGTSTALIKPRQTTESTIPVATSGSNPSLFAQAPNTRSGTQFKNVYNF